MFFSKLMRIFAHLKQLFYSNIIKYEEFRLFKRIPRRCHRRRCSGHTHGSGERIRHSRKDY